MKDREFIVSTQWGYGDDGKYYDGCDITPVKDDFDRAYDGWNMIGHAGQEGASIDVYSDLKTAIINSHYNPFKIKYNDLTNEEIKYKDNFLKDYKWDVWEGLEYVGEDAN